MPEPFKLTPIDHNKPRVAPLGLNVPANPAPPTQVGKSEHTYPSDVVPYPPDSKDFKTVDGAKKQATEEMLNYQRRIYNESVMQNPNMDIGNVRSTGTSSYATALQNAYQNMPVEEMQGKLNKAQISQNETKKKPSADMRIWDRFYRHMPNFRKLTESQNITVTDGSNKNSLIGGFAPGSGTGVFVEPAVNKVPHLLQHELFHGIQNVTSQEGQISEGPASLQKNSPDNRPSEGSNYYSNPIEVGAHIAGLKSAYYRDTGKTFEGDAKTLLKWGSSQKKPPIQVQGFQGVIDQLKINHKKDPNSPSPESFERYLTEVSNNVVKADDGPKPLMMNDGGKVPGFGNTDSKLAMLTPGEVVKTKEDVKAEESAENAPSPAPSPSPSPAPTEVETPKTPAQVVQEHRDKTQKGVTNIPPQKGIGGDLMAEQTELHTSGGLKGPFGVVSPGTGPLGLGIAAATIGTRFASHVIKSLEKNKPTTTPTPPAKVPTKPVDPKKDAYERITRERKEKKEREKKEREDKEKEPKPVEPVPEPKPDPTKPVEPKPLEPLPPIKLPPKPVPPVPNPYKPNVPRTPNPFKPHGPKNPQPYKPQEPAVPNPFVEPKPVTKPTPKPTIPDRRVDPVPEPVPPVPVPDPIPKPVPKPVPPVPEPVPVPKPKEDTTSTTETENKKSEGPTTETDTETTTDTKTELKPDKKPPPDKVETGEKEPKPASPQSIPALMMPQGHVQSFPSLITGIPTHSAPSFEKTHLEINYYTELGF